MLFLPLNLTAAFCSRWYARCGQGSSISLPQVVALHRRGAYPIRADYKERQYDLLADGVRRSLDLKKIYEIINRGIELP